MTLTDQKNPPCKRIQPTRSRSYEYSYHKEVEYSTHLRTTKQPSNCDHYECDSSPECEDDFHFQHPQPYFHHCQRYWKPQDHRGEQGGTPWTGVQGLHPSQSHVPRSWSKSSANLSTLDHSSWLPNDLIPPPPCHPPPVSVTPTKKSVQDEDTNEHSSPSEEQPDNQILELQDHDIVCGRGAPVIWQKGNQFFRDLISVHQTEYLCSTRCDKPKIAAEVMEIIKSKGGRFVRRVKASCRGRFGWEEIAENRAYEKVCQALREGAPKLRRKMLALSGPPRLHYCEPSMVTDKDNDITQDIHCI